MEYMPCSGLPVVNTPLLSMATPNRTEVSEVSAKRRPQPSRARLKMMMATPLTAMQAVNVFAGRPGIRPISLRCWDSEL